MEELDLTSAPINDYEDESGSECASDCEEHDHGSDDGSDEEESDEEMLASEMWDLNGGADLGEDDDAEMLAELDGESGSDEDEDDDELEDDEEMMDEDGYDSEAEAEMEENLMQMSNDELEMLKADMAGDEDAEMLIATVNRVQRRKAGLPSDDDEDDSEHEPTPPPVSTKKSKKRGPAPAEIPTLAPLASSSKPSKRAAGPSQANDDFVDPQALSRTDASDKASKKHTLRFHVSQVNQRQHKRENANAARIGGDDDLPRRSKERSRREVLKRQEHGGQAGEALDGAEWDESDRRMAEAVKGKAAEVEGGADDDDGDYYDLVKMSKEEGRAAKKAKYDDERLAERDEIVALANGEAGVGPRAASKMIIKNKGELPSDAHADCDTIGGDEADHDLIRRTDTAPEEGEPQQPSQEAVAVRQGPEEGCLDEADLQGARSGGQLRRRDERDQLPQRQGYQAGQVGGLGWLLFMLVATRVTLWHRLSRDVDVAAQTQGRAVPP